LLKKQDSSIFAGGGGGGKGAVFPKTSGETSP